MRAMALCLLVPIILVSPAMVSAQDVNETIRLAKEAQPLLERAARSDDANLRAPAQRLLDTIPEAVITPRDERSLELRDDIEDDVDRLVDAVREKSTRLEEEGFRCLEAREACHLKHPWLDCELAMVVCMLSAFA